MDKLAQRVIRPAVEAFGLPVVRLARIPSRDCVQPVRVGGQ